MKTHRLSPNQFWKSEEKLLLILVFLGIIALADSIIITIHHFLPNPPPDFAYSFGIPTAPAGIICYLVIIGVIVTYIRTKSRAVFLIMAFLLTMEFLEGILAFYQQTFVLKFFCEYAYLFVLISILMFGITLNLVRMHYGSDIAEKYNRSVFKNMCTRGR